MIRFLALLTISRFSASIAVMVYAASLPYLLGEWQMSGAKAGSIQSVFNLTYAISLLVTSWLADHLGAKRVFEISNILSFVSFAAFALWARSYESALVLYGIVGLTLGGSYTPALMLVAGKFPSSSRGSAMGVVLAGASLGYCASIALAAALIPVVGYRWTWMAIAVVLGLGLTAAIAALTDEPNRVFRHETPLPEEATFGATMKSRKSVMLTAGYTAHCWELLGMWAWAPTFLMVTLGAQIDWSLGVLGIAVGCLLHLSGALATLISGGLSDRLGRKLILVTMALLGAALSFVFGWSAQWGPVLLLTLAALYGFATIADSGVLSTAMTEAVAPRHLGSMLALRSILGFGAGALSPIAFGWILDLTNPGYGHSTNWGWAFAALGIGGALAALFAAMLPGDRPKQPPLTRSDL